MTDRGRLLVLGIGNPSRTDDGVGQYVVEQLALWLEHARGAGGLEPQQLGFSVVDTDCVHQLTPELSDDIKEYDAVVFVDARVGEAVPPVDLSPVAPAYRWNAVSHHWSAESLLALTAELFGKAPQAYMLSVAGHDFDFHGELSPQTRRDADLAVTRLTEFIGRGDPPRLS